MRGLECSERHPRYAVSHDPHCRCPGLSIIARFIAAPWTTKCDHWRERERQIKRLSLATLARRCRAEFGRRFPRPRRWLAVDFLGGSGDHRALAQVAPPVEYLSQRGFQTVRSVSARHPFFLCPFHRAAKPF